VLAQTVLELGNYWHWHTANIKLHSSLTTVSRKQQQIYTQTVASTWQHV